MRGFPLLRLVFLIVALLVLAWPVWLLTRGKPDGIALPPSPAEVPEKTGAYFVKLTASSPATLRVMAANQTTASSDGQVMIFESRFLMDTDEPEDLAVFAEFADKTTPHAVRVEVRIGDKIVADATLWGTGLVEDVVGISAP
jgi:hypothetical protein